MTVLLILNDNELYVYDVKNDIILTWIHKIYDGAMYLWLNKSHPEEVYLVAYHTDVEYNDDDEEDAKDMLFYSFRLFSQD